MKVRIKCKQEVRVKNNEIYLNSLLYGHIYPLRVSQKIVYLDPFPFMKDVCAEGKWPKRRYRREVA